MIEKIAYGCFFRSYLWKVLLNLVSDWFITCFHCVKGLNMVIIPVSFNFLADNIISVPLVSARIKEGPSYLVFWFHAKLCFSKSLTIFFLHRTRKLKTTRVLCSKNVWNLHFSDQYPKEGLEKFSLQNYFKGLMLNGETVPPKTFIIQKAYVLKFLFYF